MPQEGSITEEILRKIAEQAKEIEQLKEKKFGLVWEDKPDAQVLRLQDETPALIEDLTRAVVTGEEESDHLLINGDNYHALTALLATHKGKVDVIYIDPPYNTGSKDFIYNDNYLDKRDSYRHSKWLSFMEARLRLARELLSETGVIFISIDDNEHARLKLLMDEIFGVKNFITNIVWQGSPSSLARFTSGGVDYILAYAKDIKVTPRWRRKKPYAQEMVELVEKQLQKKASPEQAAVVLRAYIAKNKTRMDIGLRGYNKVDKDGRIYTDCDLVNSLPRPNLKYPLTDPETGEVYEPPQNGWKVGREMMEELLDADCVLFEGRKFPRRKLLLTEHMNALPMQSFKAERSKGSSLLNKILGKGKFDFPKNMDVIKEWIATANSNPDAVILDFFAGSGTTGHAVLELNHEDGGHRQCILITDGGKTETAGESSKNAGKDGSINIAEEVMYERLQRVATGKGWADGKEHEPLGGNLRYYKVLLAPNNGANE